MDICTWFISRKSRYKMRKYVHILYCIPCNTSNHISTSAFEDGELESFPKTNSFAREKRSGCKKKVLPSWGLAQVQRCELLVPKSEKRLAVSYTKGRPLSNTDAQTVAPISALLRSRNRLLPKLSGGKLLHVFSIQYLKTNNPVETHCLLCLSYMKNTNHPSILPRIVELSTTIFHQSSHVHLDHQRQVASGGVSFPLEPQRPKDEEVLLTIFSPFGTCPHF